MQSEAEAKIERTKQRITVAVEDAQEMHKWELKHAQYKATILASVSWLLALCAVIFTIPLIILALKLGAMLWGM